MTTSLQRGGDNDGVPTPPLAGIRILDLTRLLPGAFLTGLLADLGAEVIKVEDPRGGDYMRWMQPTVGGESAASWVLNRGKRCIAVNLKSPSGVAALLRVARTCEVVIEGFRPGVAERLGVGYDAVRAVRPDVVYASLTGYGSHGAMAQSAGHDLNYLALAGVLGMTGTSGGDLAVPGVQIADLGGASALGIGVLAALLRARTTGVGGRVEVSMYDTAVAWTSMHGAAYLASGDRSLPATAPLNGGLPCYGLYRCSDGGYLAVGALEPEFWREVCDVLGRPDLVERGWDPTARGEVADEIGSRSRDAWVEAFAGRDGCVTAVLDVGEALDSSLAHEREVVQPGPVDADVTALSLSSPIRVDGAVTPIGSPAPALGEHTRAVLAEAGLSENEIDALTAEGAVSSR
jgi:crotonobetainyl-CoA:carnitine CoA-transferase CaiB-like acyl-CoA transferase